MRGPGSGRGGWAFTHERKRSPAEPEGACGFKKDGQNARSWDASREGWIVVTVRDCLRKRPRG